MGRPKIAPLALQLATERLLAASRKDTWGRPLAHVRVACDIHNARTSPSHATLAAASVALKFPEGVARIIDAGETYKEDFTLLAAYEHVGRIFKARLMKALARAAREIENTPGVMQKDPVNQLLALLTAEATIVFSDSEAKRIATAISALGGRRITEEDVMAIAIDVFSSAAEDTFVDGEPASCGLTARHIPGGLIFVATPIVHYND